MDDNDTSRDNVDGRSLIIATGAEAVWLGAEGEDAVRGKGVSTCATCDGAFCEGKELSDVAGVFYLLVHNGWKGQRRIWQAWSIRAANSAE